MENGICMQEVYMGVVAKWAALEYVKNLHLNGLRI